MHTNNVIIAFILLSLFVYCGGNSETKAVLDKVENSIQEHPDSALVALETIDTAKLRDKSDKARYSLLMAMALDKNYIDTTDERIINPAVEYYAKHGSADKTMRSLYYLGRIQFNAQEYEKAIKTYSKALDYSKDTDDAQYKGMLDVAISSSLNATYNSSESILCLDRAYECFNEIADTGRMLTVLSLKAEAYMHSRQWASADTLFGVLNNEDKIRDENYTRFLESYAHCSVCSPMPDYQRAVKLYEEVLESSGCLSNYDDYGAYAYALSLIGEKNRSTEIFDEMQKSGLSRGIGYLYWKSRTDSEALDFESAYSLQKEYYASQDSVLRCALVQSTVKGQRDYYKEEKEASVEQVRRQRLIIFLIVTTFCLLACVAALLVQKSRQVLIRKNDRILDMYEELRSSQLEKDKKNANYISTLKEMRQGYSKLLSAELVNVFELCEKYLSKNTGNKILNSDVTSAQIREDLMKINKCGLNAVELEKFINEKMAGIMSDFRKDCLLPEESDYWLMCLLMIGLNGGVISMIMNLPTKDAVYMRKFRLKETIKSSNSMNKDKYLLVF